MIHPDIVNRYEAVIVRAGVTVPECCPVPGTGLGHLLWMLSQLRDVSMESGKANRWLGFIQGCLITRGLAAVPGERDFTRPYFKKASA